MLSALYLIGVAQTLANKRFTSAMAADGDDAPPGSRAVTYQDTDASSDSADPLISMMNSSQIDLLYQSAQFTQPSSEQVSQAAQDDPPTRPASRLTETANRLSEFAESLLDPDNEGDPFYQTVVAIYRYFGHRFSVASVLAAVHARGGDVRAAVFDLAAAGEVAEDLEFDARTVTGDRDAYFRF
jgi:hypothetical protein